MIHSILRESTPVALLVATIALIRLTQYEPNTWFIVVALFAYQIISMAYGIRQSLKQRREQKAR